jgi:hypothetical protein
MLIDSSKPSLVSLYIPLAVFVAIVTAADAILLARWHSHISDRAARIRGLCVVVLFGLLGVVGAVTVAHHRLTDLPRVKSMPIALRPDALRQLGQTLRYEVAAFGLALVALALDAAVAAWLRRRRGASAASRESAA